MLGRPAVLALLFSALAPASASAGETVARIATLPNASAAREHDGILAWNRRDAGGYHLEVLRPGERVRTIPAGPSPKPFAFDLGSDSSGAPQLVYERGGDLYAFSLARTTGERQIANANTRRRETTPTLWRGRLAFTRVYPARRGPVVYVKAMTAPRTQPSSRLPGVPRHARRTSPRTVEALELRGGRLAEVVRYADAEQSGHSETEVRLAGLRGGVRRVARMTTGEGGQTFIGPSFAGRRLWWAVTCLGDPSGCGAGVHRAARATVLFVVRRRPAPGPPRRAAA